MMRLLLAFTTLLAVATAAADFPPKGMLRTARSRAINVDGVRRDYLIQPVEGAGRFPVVILLHGGTQTAEYVWVQSSLPTLAARDRFILVAPQGIGKHWNDGRGATIAGDGPSTADDSGFLHSLILDVIKNDHGDANAVFMIGASNGGFMTMHFACTHAEDLRAASNVIADLPTTEAAKCHPAKPLPWLSMNGTADPIIPFDGQRQGVMKLGKPQPGLLSADATFAFWADRAGCGKDVKSERLPSRGVASSWAEKRTRSGCSSVQYVFHGAGHSWPNLREGPVVKLLGGSNQDVDAGEAIWNFFRSTLPH